MSDRHDRDRDRFVDDPKWATPAALIAVIAVILTIVLKACGWV